MVTPAIGVLALQGAFRAHGDVLEGLGVDVVEVRTAAQLAAVDGLVIPGGESTTMSMLLERNAMLDPLRARIHDERLPVFGTCAGMILLSDEILDGRADQHCLHALPISTRRNGYGRQLASFEAALSITGLADSFHGIFIRAPIVERVGADVEVLAWVDEHPVLCRYGAVTVAAFHPELSGDPRVHQWWLEEAGLAPVLENRRGEAEEGKR